jgi:hypothetical protein
MIGYSGTQSLILKVYVEMVDGKQKAYTYPSENSEEIEFEILGYAYYLPAHIGRSYGDGAPAEGEVNIMSIKVNDVEWNGNLSHPLRDKIEELINVAVKDGCYNYNYDEN